MRSLSRRKMSLLSMRCHQTGKGLVQHCNLQLFRNKRIFSYRKLRHQCKHIIRGLMLQAPISMILVKSDGTCCTLWTMLGIRLRDLKSFRMHSLDSFVTTSSWYTPYRTCELAKKVQAIKAQFSRLHIWPPTSSASHLKVAGDWKIDRAGLSRRAMVIDLCRLGTYFFAYFWYQLSTVHVQHSVGSLGCIAEAVDNMDLWP